MFKQSILNGIFLIISILYLYLYAVIIAGGYDLGSVPMRMANFDLPICRSYFLTGPFLRDGSPQIHHCHKKINKSVSYKSQFAITISKYEGQCAIAQI